MSPIDAARRPGAEDGKLEQECPRSAERPGLAGLVARAICSLRAGTRLLAGFALRDSGLALVRRGP